ncbi:MAG: PPOX class F420-dependent enzyme [Actinobacteria bacterium 13_1_20CM_3_71_11]|nr:MAG: PPOX class F420-dependent enzyme [Actinobacteria bacterium 13_1_20CM_3_71_11]
MRLPETAKRLLDAQTFAVVSTINPDGAPQSSVVWIKRDGDDLLFSSIRGRRKTRNLERDPRVSVVLYDPADGYSYVEVRGTVSMTEEGGDELINELARKYTGEAFTESRPGAVRVVFRITPTHVVDR